MTLDDGDLGVRPLPARPAIDGSDIRKVGSDDVPRVSHALARAFADDPVMSHVFKDESKRPAILERAFALYLRRIWLPEDECFAVDGLHGAALWLPPDRWHLGIRRQLQMLPSMIAINGRSLPRLLSVFQLIESHHPKEPHWYLAVLGVEPELQGRGFGGALMQPVLARCDRERVPAYLESSKRRNIVLYERHGFRVVEELEIPRGGPPIWRMWRDPTPEAHAA